MDILMQIVYTVLVLGFLIFVHELGHFLSARACKIRVNEFSLGMGPAILKKQGKETLYALRLFPIGGYVKVEGEDEESEDNMAMNKKPLWMRVIFVVAGAMMNLLLGFLITLILVLSSEALPSQTIAKFEDDAVSQQYGLQVGDKIIKINNKKVNIYTDIAAGLSQAYNSDTVDVTVLREGQEIPLYNVKFPVEQFGKDLFGLRNDFYVLAEDKTIANITKHTVFKTVSFITVMYETLSDLITGKASLQYISGPVGTSAVIAQAAEGGMEMLLSLVALISINLAVMNLLPIPALDGGRLLFMLIELIRGKPVASKYESVIHFVGLLLLFALMIFVTLKDIIFPVM